MPPVRVSSKRLSVPQPHFFLIANIMFLLEQLIFFCHIFAYIWTKESVTKLKNLTQLQGNAKGCYGKVLFPHYIIHPWHIYLVA